MAEIGIMTITLYRLRDGHHWRARVEYGCPEKQVEGERRPSKIEAIKSALAATEKREGKEGIF